MKKLLSKLNTYYLVALFTIISVIIIALATMACYFSGWPDVPNGLLLGGFLAAIFYLIEGIIERKETESMKSTGAIIITIVRFVVFTISLVLLALLYYKQGVHIFNIISFVGGYTISLIIFVIISLKRKKG